MKEIEYVTDIQLEKRTGIKRGTWKKWRRTEKSPPYYKLGGRVVYSWVEVQNWIASKRIGGLNEF